MNANKFLLSIVCLVGVLTNHCKPKYDLATEQAYSRYLPDRLRSLVSYVKKHGINAALSFVQTDKDLNSYLFILDAQKPIKFLAYSRAPQLINKTAQKLQSYLKSKGEGNEPISLIFDRLISTAQKGDTYVSCQFQFDLKLPFKNQVAYVHWFPDNDKNYVLGTALFTNYVPDYFIVPHRVKTVVKRIKKEGLEKVIPLLAHDLDPDGYFYLDQRKYPYREIVNGGSDKFTRKSAKEQQLLVFSDCIDPMICDFNVLLRRVDELIISGSSFYAYLWPIKNGLQLKVSYVYPVEYKKEKYVLGSGVRLIGVPNNLHEILIERIKHFLSLVEMVGLENAISVAHMENKPDAYVFVVETDPPYQHLLHQFRAIENKTVFEAQTVRKKQCGKGVCTNLVEQVRQEIRLAKDGGGFYVYLWQTEEEIPRTFLKVSFLKPFSYADKNYYVGSGYLIM